MTDEPIDFFPITVEETSWETSRETIAAIRRAVFIEEQHVPEEEEWDGLDESARHWLAWGPGDEVMATARLAGDKIGRMAVLKPYRNRGVGSTILRAIIRRAIHDRRQQLVLDAQTRAKKFYQDNGFSVTGGEFMDGGIPHVPMAMDLDRFIHRRYEPQPPDISDELRRRVELEGERDFAGAALQVATHAGREIRILSEQLDPAVYDNDDFCRAIQDLAISHPQSRIHILVRDTPWLGKNFHRLVATWQKLLSHIELRRLTKEIETPHTEFMTGDESAVLYFANPAHYQGYLCLYTPVEARRLNADFDLLWGFSEPDPQVRRLHI